MPTIIAKAAPYEGAPKINTPERFGGSTGKQMFYRIPVTGARPMHVTVSELPAGFFFENGILSGKADSDISFPVSITAENALGSDTRVLAIEIAPDNPRITPLLGFTTWNAFGSKVTQKNAEDTAAALKDAGFMEYGYDFMNIDSGWQHSYGGDFDAIQPNEKFPDMAGMTERLHTMGYHCGIYSTPMLTAWGCPKELSSIPGCTRGEPDIRFPSVMGGIGTERCEANNVRQWTEWGFDYLKYDWRPTDGYNADFMKKALLASEREFVFCLTVQCDPIYASYLKKYVNSWRHNSDSEPHWQNVVRRFLTVDTWKEHVCPGHFYDLDMLELGETYYHAYRDWQLTDDEKLVSYTMRAFFLSPIQISSAVDKLSEFEMDLLRNEEMIVLNQDALADYPVMTEEFGAAKVYRRRLANGDGAIAVFNMNDDVLHADIPLHCKHAVRDVWLKESLGDMDTLSLMMDPHSVRVFRVVEAE
ncbi:MAG: hypothetical protein E7632_13340 [Ruminococcaceae bacterium]|nr:hypothetical protein [Oscillospiraceae bacterium]